MCYVYTMYPLMRHKILTNSNNNEIALKCQKPSPVHMQISTCVLEGHVTLAKMAKNSLKF